MMIAHQHIRCWCHTEDCYSAQRSGGSRLKEQPGPGAWCVRVCVWVHTKPIETPAGYHCQPLIKRQKECIGLWHIWPPGKRAGLLGRIFSHLSFFFFLNTTASFLASEMKHIKGCGVIIFIRKNKEKNKEKNKNDGSRQKAKNDQNKRLRYDNMTP